MLHTSFMYALVNFKITATLVKAPIHGHVRNVATSLQIGQSQRYGGFQKKIVKMAII